VFKTKYAKRAAIRQLLKLVTTCMTMMLWFTGCNLSAGTASTSCQLSICSSSGYEGGSNRQWVSSFFENTVLCPMTRDCRLATGFLEVNVSSLRWIDCSSVWYFRYFITVWFLFSPPSRSLSRFNR